MSNCKPTQPFILSPGIFVALFTIIGLASCGGGGTDSAVPPAGTETASLEVPSTSPTVALTATPSLISSGATSTINWTSTNSTSCVSSGGGGVETSGSFTTPALTSNTTYTVACTGPTGIATQSTTVTVSTAAPAITLSATPASIASGATSTINWSSTNSTSCTSSGGGGSGTAGSFTTPPLTSATTYTVACTGPGGTTSQGTTVSVTGGVCATTGATSVITLSNSPGRLTGAAPLAVFFDATGTSATTTTRPFHELEYTWGFGDPAGGATWTYGSQTAASRNAARGPVATHVFETPGTYTVALGISDGTNTVSNNCTQIVVQDPDVVFAGTNTICVAAASLPVAGSGGCPAGASAAQQASFPAAISSYATTGKRVLFKRGDTFTAATSAALTRTGPGIVGSYGSGSLPTIRSTGNTTILNLSSATTPNISDWRIMDLDLDGLSGASSMGVVGNGGINQVTLLRLAIHDTHGGLKLSDSILNYYNSSGNPGHKMWDQIALVDSTILRTLGGAGSNAAGISAAHTSLLGNLIDDSSLAEHVVRFFSLAKGVVSNNTIARPAATKEVIKMHAPYWCQSSCNYLTDSPPNGVANDGINAFGYTEYVVISDNKLIAGTNSPWTVTIGPQNGSSDERVRNVIVERNWFVPGANTQTVLIMFTNLSTARNNILDLAVTGSRAIEVNRWGVEPPPANNSIYNNTIYGATSGTFNGVFVVSSATNTTVKNNLAYAPNASSPVMINGTGTGLVASNNSSDAQIKSTPPNFSVTPPTSPSHYKPAAGSYAIGGGTNVPVRSDFFFAPQTASRDIGAVIH